MRYRESPFRHTFWAKHVPTVNLETFRGQFHYLGQHETANEYASTLHRLREHDDWHLLDTLIEDDAFGVLSFVIDGQRVSRDLLDSVEEIYLLRKLGWQPNDQIRILDIGAGYGRLAHRLSAAMPNSTIWSIDAVAESTWLCEGYLGYRGVEQRVVPFDEREALDIGRFDVATNIHSWTECSTDAVQWWLNLIVRLGIPSLVFIGLHTHTTDGVDINAMIQGSGFQVVEMTTSGMHHTPTFVYGR